jgi:hypothetical protein
MLVAGIAQAMGSLARVLQIISPSVRRKELLVPEKVTVFRNGSFCRTDLPAVRFCGTRGRWNGRHRRDVGRCRVFVSRLVCWLNACRIHNVGHAVDRLDQ